MLVVRGFGSQSYADIVHDRVTADPRDGDLLVVGDFDCSGEDIERDWVARTGCWSRTERVLLTYDQVRAYELPATEGKQGDPRWPAFARRYGFDPRRPVQWEVEALEPAELQRLVLAAVAPYIDRESSPGRSPARKRNAVPWPPSWTAGTRRAGEHRRSAARVPLRPERTAMAGRPRPDHEADHAGAHPDHDVRAGRVRSDTEFEQVI
ncbi:hypothetical protein [Streptomyces cadmiisoli]|uniref:hypothetical protein n=1 Tax=Streptomyces cadmiisoli TaxID=2184053 RepID=UPI003D72E904